MPLYKKLIKKPMEEMDEINSRISDIGWEVGNTEYDLDMLPDEFEDNEWLNFAKREKIEQEIMWKAINYLRNHHIGYDKNGNPKYSIPKKQLKFLQQMI